MTPREELLEAMAKADQNSRAFGAPWEKLRPQTRIRIMQDMKKHLDAIEAHAGGCVVVPSYPTPEMHDVFFTDVHGEMYRDIHDSSTTWTGDTGNFAWSFGKLAKVSPYAPPAKKAAP